MEVNVVEQPEFAGSHDVDGGQYQRMLEGASGYFASKVELINALNVFPVPDGDTGTNMWLTLKSAMDSLDHVDEPEDLGRVADMAAAGALMGARGNSGVILSQFFRGVARGFSGKKHAGIPQVARAFQYGVVMAYRAVTVPVEGTILTVAREMARGGKIAAKEGSSLGEILEAAVSAGKVALERTTEQLPALKEAGVVDSGGCGLVILMEGFLKVALGESIPSPSEANKAHVDKIMADASGQKLLTYNYCTETLVKGTSIRLHRLKEDLEPLGDSLLVVGDENVAKVHVHTNHPGEVLELCLKRGTLHKIKIDNMLDQHRQVNFDTEEKEKSLEPESKHPSGIGLVAVCSGTGLEDIFSDLGCDRIISGGPTINPTVQEFVDAIGDFDQGVLILPNDKNIRLAAEQAAAMINRNALVIPTRNIPEGISAAMAFNPEKNLEENKEEMIQSIQGLKSAEITFSVRDSNIGGLSFKKGDIIGLMGGKVAAAGKSYGEVLMAVLEGLVKEGDEIISIVYGKDVAEEDAETLHQQTADRFPDQEIEFLSGGQPLYYFYVSVE